MKRIIVFLLCLLSLSVTAGVAQTPTYAKVTTERVNMRSEGNAQASIVAELTEGTVVRVLSADQWAQVLYDGKTGYINQRFLATLSEEEVNQLRIAQQQTKMLDSRQQSADGGYFECAWHDWRWPFFLILILGVALTVVVLIGHEEKKWIMAQTGIYIALSLVEILQFVGSVNPAWFCKPDVVGWLWTIIYFILMVALFVWQIYVFNKLLVLATRHNGVNCTWKIGLYGLPIALIIAAICYWIDAVSLTGAVWLVLIPQFVQLITFFIQTARGNGDWGIAALTTVLYVVGICAVAIAGAALIAIIITVFVAYLVLSYFTDSWLKSPDMMGAGRSQSVAQPVQEDHDVEFQNGVKGKYIPFTGEQELKGDDGHEYERDNAWTDEWHRKTTD